MHENNINHKICIKIVPVVAMNKQELNKKPTDCGK
jgi:hypothetical protein